MKALLLKGDWVPRLQSPKVSERTGRAFASNANHAWRNPQLSLVDMEVPEPGAGEVLLRVAFCGVCGTDVHSVKSGPDGYVDFSGPMALPVVLGHEFSGEVVKLGPGVRNLKLGTHVAVESILWCGVCDVCRRGAVNQCRNIELLGLTRQGAFAEFIVVSERHCWDLKPLVDGGFGREGALTMGALLEPIGCAYNGMFVEAGGFAPGAFVVIHGAGPIGLGAVMLARAAGAARVIVLEPQEGRRQLALDLGADIVLAPDEAQKHPGGVGAWIQSQTLGEGADLQVEAAGVYSDSIPSLQKGLAPSGTLVYLGRGSIQGGLDLNGLVSGAQTIVGARGHAGSAIFPMLMRLIAGGRMPVERMFEAQHSLENVVAAIELAGKRAGGKVLIDLRSGGES